MVQCIHILKELIVMSGAHSRDVPVGSQSPPASTSASSYDVSTIDNSGRRLNISVEGLNPTIKTSQGRATRRRKRRYLGSGRQTSETTLSPDSRPLSSIRKSEGNSAISPSKSKGNCFFVPGSFTFGWVQKQPCF